MMSEKPSGSKRAMMIEKPHPSQASQTYFETPKAKERAIMKNPPDNILRLMNPADRPKGPAGWTAAESGARYVQRTERQEQAEFAKWLSRQQSMGELIYFWQRTDKRATGTPGWPDFSVYSAGQSFFLELKVEGGLLSDAQKECLDWLLGHEFKVAIPPTADEAIRITKQWMASLRASTGPKLL